MVTFTISIRPCLAAYLYVRYKHCVESFGHPGSPPDPIHLPPTAPFYHALHALTVLRPGNAPVRESGNITFVLPAPRHGKNPEVYNYPGRDNLLILEKIIETELKEHLYEYMKEGNYLSGVPYRQSLRHFLKEYGMEERASEEGIIRTFQRWRKKMREMEIYSVTHISLFLSIVKHFFPIISDLCHQK